MGSSDSLSLPSEPPYIAKWFPSYVYESPELNSIDDFKDSGRPILAETGENEEEKEGNFDENGVLKKRHDVLLADGKDTSDGFLQSNSIARIDNRNIEVLKDSDSLSLSSVPPDVRNWFSSYEYESPAINTSYEFSSQPHGNVFDEECITGKEDKLIRATKAVQKNDLEGQKTSFGLVKCTNSGRKKEYEHHSFPKDILKADGEKNSAILNDLTPQRRSCQILPLKQMIDHGKGLAEGFELSIQNGKSPIDALNAKFNAEHSHMMLNIKSRSGSKMGNSPHKAIQSRVPIEESDKPEHFTIVTTTRPPTENLEYLVNQKPENEALGGQENKENARTGFAENGFISMRRSKVGDGENSCKGPLAGESYSSRNGATVPPRGNKEATATRKILLDTTNFQAPNLLEVTGKWRCPQKSKPNLGPPLKQLRLEQWVRRV